MTTENQKVALVTNGVKRLGHSIALTLAQRGWNVAVHYEQLQELQEEAQATVRDIERLGRRAIALPCDLADENGVKALLPQAAQTLGPVCCVVNNASLLKRDSVADFSLAGFNKHMHVNLGAPILLAQGLYNATPTGKQSVVVNLIDHKLFNLNPDFLSYTLSKAALHTATTMLAQALAPKVRVVGIATGIALVSSSQTDAGAAETHVAPPGFTSTQDDIANTVGFVVDNPALTGTTLLVDGGQHLLPPQRDIQSAAK